MVLDHADPMLSPGQTARLYLACRPAIVVTAGHDPLVDEGDNYAKRLEADGVDVIHKRYDTLAHAFTAFTDFSPGSRAACVEIAGFVRDMYSRR